jgi:hypothetical protein
LIPKRNKDTDVASDIAQGKFFQKRLRQAAEEAAERFVNGEGINDAMADIAKRENFNQLQIQRLVEEGNTLAFNKKYTERKKDSDRRISFELGELSVILEKMGTEAPPELENPNWVKGKPGDGEMTKSASTQPMFSMNSTIDASRQKLHEKQAKERTTLLEKQARDLSREIESGIFKIAQSLVVTEKTYKNANQVFNTMLSETNFDDFLVEGISKKAEEITNHFKNTGRAHSQFMVSLEVKPEEKVASTLLGGKSLLKQANDPTLVEQPKVAPIQDVGDFAKLISLAQDIQRKQQASLAVENELHGGVPIG